MNSEDAYAALGAPGLADQPISAATGGVGERGVEYLHQLVVTRGKHKTMLNGCKLGKINRVYQL
jgi:hypothetical protein